ncbi:MAG: hypothetical protein CL534_22815 [Ahrensia sp.]|nr:hypothetical protein [Ahrensia sp.]
MICLSGGMVLDAGVSPSLQWFSGGMAPQDEPDQHNSRPAAVKGVEPVMVGLKQFCFATGEANREETCAARSGTTGKRADAAGVRRTKTRRAGHVRPNPRGLRLGRILIRPSPNPLILGQTCSGRMVQSNHDRLWAFAQKKTGGAFAPPAGKPVPGACNQQE